VLDALIASAPRYLFFTGKGGVGKTSVSSAVAIALADAGARVLLVSTDPASNLSEVLGVGVGSAPTQVPGTKSLFAMDIDPIAAAATYRERVVGPYRGVLPDAVVGGIEEQLSGSCTVEIAAFDQFTGLLTQASDFDHIVFDTAPTGHTLRLLSLPGAWTEYLDANQVGVTCVGPLSGLTQQRGRYRQALRALGDPASTTLVMVTRPERTALDEARRASRELKAVGIANQVVVVNGVYPTANTHDPLGRAMAERQALAMSGIGEELAPLPREELPLTPVPPIGVQRLRSLLHPAVAGGEESSPVMARGEPQTLALDQLIAELATSRRGLVMTVGKGGVGKTTVAAAVAVALASRGVPVTLTTTDPAAHLVNALGGDQGRLDALTVERIDPMAATRAYTDEVLATAGANLDAAGRAVLLEDLRSPCTEEIAVFRAFASVVGRAEAGVVVLDTAPSGHTLLLLDAARSYEREVRRQATAAPPEVESLLRHLADPDFTSVLVVTIPAATAVHEATALQVDLLRAGIRPRAWVVNQSFHAAGTADQLLGAIAAHEVRWIQEAGRAGGSLAVLPWEPEPPVGGVGLARLIGQSAATVLA